MTPSDDRYDAVIVGSGFGGSVMAHRLAAAEPKLNVCLLERGKAWPPGSFPRTPAEFQRALWAPGEGQHGLYDVWSFSGIGALVSSGLGGGSLIYANVMLPKDADSFVHDTVFDGPPRWPIDRADLDPHYAAVATTLSPVEYPEHLLAVTPKARAFRAAAEGMGLVPTPLAVTFSSEDEEPGTPFGEPGDNLHGRQRYTCRLGGECDVGCNFGSKNSLDYTYLSAAKRAGAEIRCRHEVKLVAPDGDGYRLEVVDHTDAVEGQPPSVPPRRLTLRTRRLILSAGALGTPYLLLSNRSSFPRISRRLGERFCGNGDFLAFAARCREPLESAVGPVITSAVRTPTHYIEDGGYPVFLAWVAQMLDTPRIAWGARRVGLHLLWRRLTGRRERNISFELSELLGDPRVSAGTLPILGMGLEPPQGRQKLRDGLLDIEWSFDRARPYFDSVRGTIAELSERLGGRFEDDILWRLNAVMTVHPLGGCPMGATADEGVVDPRSGEVHNYPRLHVADGSVMPGPVGANPSMTIAAVADRFADAILAEEGRL